MSRPKCYQSPLARKEFSHFSSFKKSNLLMTLNSQIRPSNESKTGIIVLGNRFACRDKYPPGF